MLLVKNTNNGGWVELKLGDIAEKCCWWDTNNGDVDIFDDERKQW
ncbi:hypothetical protein SAMN04488109_3358 [Chryseolinea serpens]|uniref:Uncharacterized protein n=1 Tax=Chryseolinea serpens TaxID=947013 RepID=A0A1M5RFS7_9BACT|nr:hypothetical protein [Chryseolinea serpens]SHH24859.1 hypothetical protein SAMN04488109_3358 [Chryseolinea serpens]